MGSTRARHRQRAGSRAHGTLAALALLAFGAPPAGASEGPPPILQPTTYGSSSGRYELFVDPSHRSGAGEGAYELRRDGEVVWAARRPYTFWEAVVTDDGRAAGYAYTAGWRDHRVEGHFVVAILAPDGSEVAIDAEPRRRTRRMHSPPDPLARGLFAQPELDRVVVRVLDPDASSHDEWRPYRLTTGERLSRVPPHEAFPDVESLQSTWGARAVPGTPLALVWFRRALPEGGSRFALLDADGYAEWVLDLPRDFPPTDVARETGAILEVDSRRFSLWHVRAEERVEYGVDSSSSGEWVVRETGRAPGPSVRRSRPEEPPKPPWIDLDALGVTTLGGPEDRARASIRGVVAFTHRGGSIELVRRESEPGTFTLAVVDGQGHVQRSRVVELPIKASSVVRWFPLSRGWLVSAPTMAVGRPVGAWRVGLEDGELHILERFRGPQLHRLEELPDGGLVALASQSSGSWPSEAIFGLEADGSRRWRRGTVGAMRGRVDPAGVLLSPADLAAVPDGRVAVLEHGEIEVHASDGEHVRTIDLDTSWGRAPRYPTGIVASPDGSVFVSDSPRAEPSIWHMDLDGTVLGRLTPRFVDGRQPRRVSVRPAVDADGRLWISDGDAFLRLDETGLVDRVVGSPPAADAIDLPGSAAIGPQGRVAVLDDRDRSVHVFAPDGRRLASGSAAPDDFERAREGLSTRMAMAPDGRVYVQSYLFSDRLVVFGPDGRREGIVQLGDGLAFDPRGGRRWMLQSDGYAGEDLVLQEQDGHVVTTIRRNPDGTWFQGRPAVAPDSRLCVIGRDYLAIHAPDGELLRTFPTPRLPSRAPAFAADWVVTSWFGNEAYLFHVPDGTLHRFRVPDLADGAAVVFGFSPDATELWALSVADLELHRFALPR